MAKFYESITISDAASAVNSKITGIAYGQAEHVLHNAFITVEGGAIRVRWDGTAPTTDEGHLFYPGDTLIISGYRNIQNFKAIKDATATATLRCTYE